MCLICNTKCLHMPHKIINTFWLFSLYTIHTTKELIHISSFLNSSELNYALKSQFLWDFVFGVSIWSCIIIIIMSTCQSSVCRFVITWINEIKNNLNILTPQAFSDREYFHQCKGVSFWTIVLTHKNVIICPDDVLAICLKSFFFCWTL